ncbi:hypothetical protein [Streptococcus salivarius]
MEYEICLYLYYNREQKIEILFNKVIPLLEKLDIRTYYFTTHWAHGTHISIIFEDDNIDGVDFLKRQFEKLLEEVDYRESAELSVETVKNLIEMESYQQNALPIYKNKTVTVSKFYIEKNSDEYISYFTQIYHKYDYKFNKFVLELLKEEQLESNNFTNIIRYLKFILSFSKNTLGEEGLKSLYISLKSHYYSFKYHPYSNLIKGYFYEFEKYYEDNSSAIKLELDLFLKQNLFDVELIYLINSLSMEIREINEQVPTSVKEENLRRTKQFIESSLAEKSSFHNTWINQPNIDNIIMSDEYIINRFTINYLYTLYPKLYISPKTKHFLGYILYRYLDENLDINWKWEGKKDD